jgi:hypothetical protein
MLVGETGAFPVVTGDKPFDRKAKALRLAQIHLLLTRWVNRAHSSLQWNSHATLFLIIATCTVAAVPVVNTCVHVGSSGSHSLPQAMCPISATGLTRPEGDADPEDCASYWLPMPSGLAQSDTLIKTLPAGRRFDVVLRGQLATPLPDRDYGVHRSWYMLHAFEVHYQRTIESNDGQRITERRDYGAVRSAKLLIPRGNVEVSSDLFGKWSLAEMWFPDSSQGIYLVSPAALASCLMAPENRRLAEHADSRGFVETDTLSRRSVRFVFASGVGLESVEPIGWHPTVEEMGLLVMRTAPIEWWAATIGSSLQHEQPVTTGSEILGDFLRGPAMWIPVGIPVVLSAEPSWSDLKSRRLSVRSQREDQGTLTGRLTYDPSCGCVTSAELACESAFLRGSIYHLLFENLWTVSTPVTVRYECAPTEDVSKGPFRLCSSNSP